MTRDVFKYFKHVRSLQESKGAEKASELGYSHQARGVYIDPKTQKRYKNVGDRLEPYDLPDRMANSPAGQAETEAEKKSLDQFSQDASGAQATPTALPQIPDGISDQEYAEKKAKEFTGGRKVTPERQKEVKRAANTLVAMANQQAAAAAAVEEEPPAEEEPTEEPQATEEAPEKKPEDFPTIEDKVAEKEKEDADLDLDDEVEKVTSEYKEKLGEVTKQQEKRINDIKEAIGKIEDPDKKKSFVNALSLAYGYTGRINSGAGKNALGKVDYELLESNRKRLQEGYGDGSPETIKEFVESTRAIEVTDEEAEIFFDALPQKLRSNFQGAGKISDSYTGHSLGIDKDGNQLRGKLTGKTNGVANGRLRGLMVAKLFLQQGGKDGYSGADLDLNATDLEHVRGFNNKDDGAPTQEMKDQRENVDNFILTASNLNQTKLDKGMDEWYKTEVDKLKDFTDEDYETRDALTEESNTVNDKARLVNSLFMENGKLSESATSELFDLYSENDRKIAKTINSNIGKFGKTKGVSLPKVKNRIGYEMIKELDLGGYMKKKSGRGNQGKLDDKVYSAFVSTLMDQDEAGRARLSQVWRDAREMGSQAAFDQQNDGAAKSTLIDYVKKNGGFADRFLKNKEFKKILSESLETGRFMIERLKRSLRDLSI